MKYTFINKKSAIEAILRVFLCALIWATPTYAQHVGIDELTTEQIQELLRLKNLHWVDALNSDQVTFVAQNLNSNFLALRMEALKAVAIHQVQDLQPNLQNSLGDIDSPDYRVNSLISPLLGQDEGMFRTQLLSSLSNSSAVDDSPYWTNEKIQRSAIKDILVVLEAKAIRRGDSEQLSMSGLQLSNEQSLILTNSTKPNQDAIDELVQTIISSEIAGIEEYELLHVLHSYGETAVREVVNILLDESGRDGISTYGKVLTMHLLRAHTEFLTDEEKVNLASLMMGQPEYFSSPPQLSIAVDYFLQEIGSSQN